MHYLDRVYGETVISEPILLDLMQTQAVQRLHGVLQHGISGLLGVTRPTTRFEHSIGVMLLVRRLGATLDEQIAALLHDVSHTAFSHVIDYVFHGHDVQSYHEEKKETFIAASDLPPVLAAHGYSWQDFLHEENFPLLEQPSPALCADRLDYFLRDGRDLGLASEAGVKVALEHLVAYQGRIVVDDLEAARWIGDTFMAGDDASWSNFREVGLYELAAQAIRRGLEIGALSEADLWTTDRQAWDRLCAHTDASLQALLATVSLQTRFEWDDDHPTFRVSTKVRTLDPDVLLDGRLQPLSALDPDFARRRQDYIARKSGRWPVRVISGG